MEMLRVPLVSFVCLVLIAGCAFDSDQRTPAAMRTMSIYQRQADAGEVPAVDGPFDAVVRIEVSADVPSPKICSGVAITERHILTAARCLMDENLKPMTDHQIRALGIFDRFGNAFEVISWRINRFEIINNILKTDTDLAVVRVRSTDSAQTVLSHVRIAEDAGAVEQRLRRASDRLSPGDDSLMISGYGMADNEANSVGQLRIAALPFRKYFGVHSEELHAGSWVSHPCYGDEGGGLFLDMDDEYALIGITSRNVTPQSTSCIDSDGFYFANLSDVDVRDWVDNAVSELHEDGPHQPGDADVGDEPDTDADAGGEPDADADAGDEPDADADAGDEPDADAGDEPDADADAGDEPDADADHGEESRNESGSSCGGCSMSGAPISPIFPSLLGIIFWGISRKKVL